MSEIFHQFLTGGWKPGTFSIWKISEHDQKPLNVDVHIKTFHSSMMGGF